MQTPGGAFLFNENLKNTRKPLQYSWLTLTSMACIVVLVALSSLSTCFYVPLHCTTQKKPLDVPCERNKWLLLLGRFHYLTRVPHRGTAIVVAWSNEIPFPEYAFMYISYACVRLFKGMHFLSEILVKIACADNVAPTAAMHRSLVASSIQT